MKLNQNSMNWINLTIIILFRLINEFTNFIVWITIANKLNMINIIVYIVKTLSLNIEWLKYNCMMYIDFFNFDVAIRTCFNVFDQSN